MRNNRRAEDGKSTRSGSFKDQKKQQRQQRGPRLQGNESRRDGTYSDESSRNGKSGHRGRRGNEDKSEYAAKRHEGRRNYRENEAAPDADFLQNPNRLEGRNAVLEAYRSGRTVDKIYLQADLHDGMILTIAREARKAGSVISYVPKTRLDQMSETGSHQGVIALVASFDYAEVADILQKAKDKGEDPFLFLLDGIEDPHNLGAIIRTANLAGAHGVIITKHRAVGLTATVAKASAGAINYTPVAKVTNLAGTIEELKAQGIWFVCAAMDGTRMYDLNLNGPIGVVIGNEGEGVSRLVREKCDMTASIPMKGDIDSLNASVAAGVLAFEVVRQRG